MYLPVHAKMYPTLRKGMNVIHNGGGTRQGKTAVIQSVGSDGIIIVFDHYTNTSTYTAEWFMLNFYIAVSGIQKMKGIFDGRKYIEKYEDYRLPHHQLGVKRHTHPSIKLIVDNKLIDKEAKESVSHRDASSIDKPSDPLLDSIGDFKVCNQDGHLVSDHKTQRLAEIASIAHSREHGVKCNIWKMVSSTEVEWKIGRK